VNRIFDNFDPGKTVTQPKPNNYFMDSYLKAIKESNNRGLNNIYTKFFPLLKTYIIKSGGSEIDAQDCFQEALISTFKRLQREDFEIKTTFSTYIFNVGKFIWFKKAKKSSLTSSIEDFKHGELDKIEETLEEESKYSLFQKGLKALNEDCQKILAYYFKGKSFKEIATLMEYTGAEYARRKKYLCTKSLTTIVKSDPFYSEMY